jgi:endonuclease/exonuclease/phosphatase family metal-dependent hydrolase/uncharacterized protein YraI
MVRNSGKIIAKNVALRKGPDVDSALIGRLNAGTYVQIVKTNVDAQWHQVKYNDNTGYVNRMYVSLDSSLDGYKLDFVGTIINCKNDVNVRSAPSTESKIIGTAKKGSNLTILPLDTYIQDWYKVEYEGVLAYIHADYLDVVAKVNDSQLSNLSIKGGTIFPGFSPNEYGYVVKATASEVTIKAEANEGVDIDINGTGKSSYSIAIPASGMKTVRIALDGKIRYSVYISRNVLTVGTWNIKRGSGKLLMQGRLVYDQQPDIMGIQEAFVNLNASDVVDNLASLKTKDMSNCFFSATINYSNGSQYGNGLMSRFTLQNKKTYTLDSGKYEKRVLQKAVVTINGKTVSLYNTHLTYNTAEVRAKQFAQIKSIMDSDPNKYKILTGDFNANISEISVFNNYKVVNTAQTKYYDYSRNLIDVSEIDNVVVTKNIDVINSRIVITRFSDHYPVFAYLVLN